MENEMAANDLQGYGHSYVVSDEQKLDWEAVELYLTEIHKVAIAIFANLSLSMNVDKDVLGVTPHSDGITITLLLQDDEISGLQMKHNKVWVPVNVKPIPNAIVVNVGDVWSNGEYKSVVHRAVTNPKQARTSIATFVMPDEQVQIGPLDSMLDASNPQMYKKIKYLHYIRYTWEGKSNIHFLKLEDDSGSEGRGRIKSGGSIFGEICRIEFESSSSSTEISTDNKVENEGKQSDECLSCTRAIKPQSVQELVKKNPRCVPEIYIQEQDQPSHSALSLLSSSEIPVIDLSSLAIGDENEQRKLDMACKEWGFFQYARAANDIQGYGHGLLIADQKKLDWNDALYLVQYPTEVKNLKLWPTNLPGFKESIELFSTEIDKVANQVFSNLSLLMGIEQDGLSKLHGDMRQAIKLNYYPSCLRPDLVFGVAPHSDGSSMTLLLQDNDVTGLHIRHKGEWVTVKPIPNAIVVNIGDILEVWSNGLYKSIEHRAVTNEKKARMSIATFFFPGFEAEIKPLDSMVDGIGRARMYKSVKFSDYIQQRLKTNFEGKTQFLRIGS
ncbi:Isopenicillin N synthase-like, Fe(2+) 2OG dioxygenase domain [Dillenia turbinata]|uniref:Isopenicillin N synthase-like, Fe(2+) 2OG dioxygenase domain n=1 Tax=Dillenia turbinata TaxID=194707 RepID=A0AAN8VDP3_9MAGN